MLKNIEASKKDQQIQLDLRFKQFNIDKENNK